MRLFKLIFTHIPNGITSLNVLSGCLSIACAFNNHLTTAAIFIFFAGIFDFFDGLSARMLKAYSEMGKSLDSLADVISFGVAPSVIMLQLLLISVRKEYPEIQLESASFGILLIVYSSFIIAIFSAIRLAKFNTDPRQAESFIGVPTPANAFFIASLVFVIKDYSIFSEWLLNYRILIPLFIILSVLLVAEIPMIALKFKNLSVKDNKAQYLLVGIAIILISIFKLSAYPLIFITYLILSIIFNPQKKLNH